MKKLLRLGTLAGILLLNGCSNSQQNGLEAFSDKEKISGDFTTEQIMKSASFYTLTYGCYAVEDNTLMKNYGKKAAELYEVEESDLTSTDIRQFFISGLIQNGLFGDKNYQNKIYQDNELKRYLSLGKYKGKLSFELLGTSKGLFFFENKADCEDFLSKNIKKR